MTTMMSRRRLIRSVVALLAVAAFDIALSAALQEGDMISLDNFPPPVPLVECPCPDNDQRVANGMEKRFYVTHVDVGNGEVCPDKASAQKCPQFLTP
mmetsp:Transcript_31665/g.58364  ORF Transcript_31665/g.58364 Transcript_31665/m.58364 type:complete len:97 (-) Transcript_31665:22-312(-)